VRLSRCPPTLPALHRSSMAAADRSPATVDHTSGPGGQGGALSKKFRIDGIIGTGGMGIVVAAHHLALDIRVAIKLMRPDLRVRAELVRRFLREARAAARLRSRHGTRVFDVGTLDDGAPYIVMEYLDGIDLAAWLRQRGPVPIALAAAIVAQVSDAIAEAHAAGIIHRDLKPANLFLTRDRDGESLVKVLDLGICKLVEPTDDVRDTSIATGLGTPAYMAPEQFATASRADARSDIWSLGVILCELVTGRVPFGGHTVAELHARVASEPCPRIEGVPSDFDALVARCLAKDPKARFQRVDELAAALAPFAATTYPVMPVAWSKPRPKRTVRRVLFAFPLAALVSAGAWRLALSSDEPTAPPARSAAPPPGLAGTPEVVSRPGRPMQPEVRAPAGRAAKLDVASPPGRAVPSGPALPPGPALLSGPALPSALAVPPGAQPRSRLVPPSVSTSARASQSRVASRSELTPRTDVAPPPRLAPPSGSRPGFVRPAEATTASSYALNPAGISGEHAQEAPSGGAAETLLAPAIDANAPAAATIDPMATPY
jgi:serine/threonine protein kinase